MLGSNRLCKMTRVILIFECIDGALRGPSNSKNPLYIRSRNQQGKDNCDILEYDTRQDITQRQRRESRHMNGLFEAPIT